MKIVSKIKSLVLALTLLCTMATPAFAASKGPNTRAQYAAMVSEETGIPAITTAEFLQKMGAASEFFRLVTGDRFPTKENINVSFDENLVELNTYIVLNSGLDIIAIAESLPEIGSNAELIANGFEADPAELRDAFYKMSDDYRAHGNDSMATTCRLLGGYLGVVEKLYFYTVQTENPDIYELYLEVTFKDGATEIDMVINITDVKNGDYDKVEAEIKALREATGDKILKVIIETCYLTEEEKTAFYEAANRK